MAETIFILASFVVFAIIFERFGLGTIIGLLIAGMVIGPHGAGLIRHMDWVDALAELGITFLLFTIGLELKISRLKLYGWSTYLLAAAQLGGTTLVLAAIGYLFGLEPKVAIVVGIALAFSSTALVLQLLHDFGRTITVLGRMAIAILLIQDIAVGPVLIAVEAAGQGSQGVGPFLIVIGKSALIAALILVGGRTLLEPILRVVSGTESHEAFLATVLILVLTAGAGMHWAGSSAAIGAFLAGLTVAETKYRHQIAADIAPFKGLLLGLFFMSIGAKANLPLVVEQYLLITAIAVGLVALKWAILIGLVRLAGHPTRMAVSLGLLLSEGSEFAFVIIVVAVSASILPPELADILTAAVGLSLIIVAILARAGRVVLDRVEGEALASVEQIDRQTEDLSGHVLIIGFGQVGLALTRHLIGLGVPVLVIDYNSARVRRLREHGLPVYYGNALRADVLRSCKLADAKIAVIAVPDTDVSVRILEIVRQIAPDQFVISRSSDDTGSSELVRAGANVVVEDSLTTALDLAERVAVMYAPPETPEDSRLFSARDLEFD